MSADATIRAGLLEAFVGTLSPLVDEAVLELSNDGLGSTAVDPAVVALVDSTLDTRAFDYLDAPEATLGLGAGAFPMVETTLGLVDADTAIGLSVEWGGGDPERLHIDAETMAVTVDLVDPESIRPVRDVPDDFERAAVAVDAVEFLRALRGARIVFDTNRQQSDVGPVSIGYNGTLAIEADGDTDAMHAEPDVLDVMQPVDGAVRSTFSIGYLWDVRTAIPSGADLGIVVGDAVPLDLRFSYARLDESPGEGGGETQGHATYTIAPQTGDNGGVGA